MRRGLSHLWLKPHPHYEGWTIGEDRIEGRLEWNETGLPHDAVVDGRRLSWEELGRALEPFEGWELTLSFEGIDVGDASESEANANVIAWPGQDAPVEADQGPSHDSEALLWDLDDEDEEDEFLAAWDQAETDAVDLLRRALPELVDAEPPPGALVAAADSLRAGMRSRKWPYEHVRRAAGFTANRLPETNLEVWLGAGGGLICMREESGMGIEENSALMTNSRMPSSSPPHDLLAGSDESSSARSLSAPLEARTGLGQQSCFGRWACSTFPRSRASIRS